jgi:FtsH-binding integral membrane protein
MLMKDPFMHMDEASKHIIDFASIVTVLGTLADMLPAIAAIFTIVWTAIRIYETKTVQRWLGKKDAVDK